MSKDKEMILITTSIGKGTLAVGAYLGIVVGEAIIYKPGASNNLSYLVDTDKYSKIDDELYLYESSKLEKAREFAMRKMKEKAKEMGADAVVGVDLNYEAVDSREVFIVTVSGTAVKLING